MGRVRSRWEKTARSPGAAGAGGRRRRRPAGPLCAARVRARAKAARSWFSLGLGSKRITRRAMTSTSVSLAWSLPDSTNLSPVKVMAGRSFFSCARERASVSAPRATACHCTRCGRAHRVGQKEHRRGKRRASRERGGAPRPSPRSAQVPIHHPGHVHVQPALADSGYPARPGRLGGRLAAAAASSAPGCSFIARACRGQAGPEAPKQCKHVSLPCLGSESYPSPVDQRRRTKTPLKRLQIQFGFGAWKINVLVDHFTH